MTEYPVPCRQSREKRFKAALALLEAGESEALIFTEGRYGCVWEAWHDDLARRYSYRPRALSLCGASITTRLLRGVSVLRGLVGV